MKTPQNALKKIWRNRDLYLMLAPILFYLLLFVFWPIIQGVVMSFQDFTFINDSDFIGVEHYRAMFKDKSFWNAFRNTLVFAFFNVVLGVLLPCILAITLSEIANGVFRRFTQTVLYIPNLFSWVVVGSAFMMLLSPSTGPLNYLISQLGGEPVYFFGKADLSKPLILFINQWKITGYGIIIYLAAIVGISPEQYEAAEMDGANRFQKVLHITFPNLMNTIKVMVMLNIMGMFMLFDPVYVLQNEVTREANDVLMTYIYRTGILKLNLGYGAAISVFISAFTFVVTVVAKKLTGYGFEE